MFDGKMNFQLGEDIENLRASVKLFATNEILPIASEIDKNNDFPMNL